MSSVLTLESLMAAAASPKLQIEPVAVNEFGGGTVAWVAELSADEKESRIEAPWMKHKEATGEDDPSGFRAHVVAACWCVNQDRVFAAKSPEEIRKAAELWGKQGKATSRMFAMADKLNAIGSGELEGIEKNLPASGDGSGT